MLSEGGTASMNGATTIQERLKDLRLNKGLKLEELAEQTGISKSALGSYEKDDYKEINHGNLILLADFYGGGAIPIWLWAFLYGIYIF